MFLSFITSKLGLTLIAVALVVAVIGVQTLRLDHAKADLRTAQDGLAHCQASVAAQNASIAARAAQSAKALASAAEQAKAVTPRAQHITQKAAALSVYTVKGTDRCARWEDAEQAVRDSLK